MSDGWCIECGKDPSFQSGFKAGIREAVAEVQGWRELTVKAFREVPCVDPKEAARECKNKLNLLGVIESKLRKMAGDDPKAIFRENIERSKAEGIEYPLASAPKVSEDG